MNPHYFFTAHTRRTWLMQSGICALGMAGLPAQAQSVRQSVTLNIALEPDGLDPTAFPAAATGQVVLYNVLEGLVKIAENGAVQPLLAKDWQLDASQRIYIFNLQPGVKFHDGRPLDAACVLYSFRKALAPESQNKAKKNVFNNILRLTALDPLRVQIELAHPDPHFLFHLGEATAVILHPASAAQAAEHPVGTGPYAFVKWRKGHSVVLRKAPMYRAASTVAIEHATFRFINNLEEQAQALEQGEVDVFINFITHALHRFHSDPRYQVLLSASSGKGLLALNHRHPYLGDLRVRQAITHAIDRQAFVTEVLKGKGALIGSHFSPADQGYLNLSHLYAYNPERARALLKQANVPLPLQLTLTSLPVPYAREGAPLIAEYLRQVGIHVQIQEVSWPEWMAHTFKGQFDLTLISHVEPLDYMIYTDPQYYFGYDSAEFRALVTRHAESENPRERQSLFVAIQRYLAQDAANVWLFSSQLSTVARKGLQGLWMNYPIMTHDLAALRWTS